MNIKKERERIEKNIKLWDEALYNLRMMCPHPNKLKEHKSDTGNWDPYQDRYWTEFTCPDCGKFWIEEGSK